MRSMFLAGWLMIPVAVGAYHLGPGQDRLVLDDVSTTLAEAERAAAQQQWAEALAGYEEVLNLLPSERVDDVRRVRLERAKAQMFVKQLPAAHQDLKALLDELKEDDNADPKLLDETRATLANSQYYITWLMRLEGRPPEDWEPEIEAARQTYRLLAENAEQDGDADQAKENFDNLESAIRLARMDLRELQGLPLPSQ